MTVTVEEDFREFVVARWGELEPVAHLVTLDGAARPPDHDRCARRPARPLGRTCSTRGCRALRPAVRCSARPWTRAVTGRWCGSAQRLSARPGPSRASRRDARRPVRRRAAPGRALGGRPGAGRAGRRHGVGPRCGSGRRPAGHADRPRARRRSPRCAARLLAAHTAARAAGGWEPAEWALDRDLEDALDVLLTDLADPPDAVALVGERHRRVRRRSVVLGTGAAGGGGGRLPRGASRRSTSGATSQADPLPPGPGGPGLGDDGQLAGPRPPRHGRRGHRPRGRGLPPGLTSSGPTTWPPSGSSWPRRRMPAASGEPWSGCGRVHAARTRPRSPRSTWCATGSSFVDDVVPITVDAAPVTGAGAGAVLLLARPAVLEASYSLLVSYTRGGGVGRQWTDVLLRDGVATVELRGRCRRPSGCASTATTAARSGRHRSVSPCPTILGRPWPTACSRWSARSSRPAPACPSRRCAARWRSRATVDGDVLVPAAPGEQPRPAAASWWSTPRCRASPAAHRPSGRRQPWGRSARSTSILDPGHRVEARPRCRSPPWAPGLSQRREPLPRGRARRCARPAGGHGVEHLPGLRGHRAA